MSLIPFILDLADELHEFSRCLANGIDINDFGFGLYTGTEQQQQQQQPPQQQQSHQQQSPRRSRTSSFSSFWMPSKRHHPYNRIKSACCGKNVGEEGGGVSGASPEKDASPTGTPGKTASYSVVNKNGFQVSMNVKQFAPNELSVKTIDNCIVVEGRHDDKEDGHGVISRHFVRKYMLPKGYDPKDVLSTLSSDGILTVKAPPPPPPSAKSDEPNERIVEIQPTTGPTQVVPVVSAKETQSKELNKKLSSPATRVECQLPEKRQKFDLPQEPEEPEPTEAHKPTTRTLTPSPAAAAAAAALNDVANEKAEVQTAENDKQQQKEEQQKVDSGAGTGDVENKVAADQVEKQLEKEEVMEIDETDKTVEEKKLPETNGDTNISTESTEANKQAADSGKTSAKDNVPADIVSECDAKSNASKMDVDDAADTKANVDDAKADVKTDGKATVTETKNTNSTPTKNTKKDEKDNTATGELTADILKSAATTNNTTTAAESANVGAAATETAVLPTETPNIDIDDVALLKAAVTADASDITAAEENALLSEPMDGIATTDSPSAVDTVECSLFAKTRLGNGNSNSAALVATEEVAN